jgi:acyl dehydratase
MEGRFSKPVYPGDTLTVSMWVDGSSAVFRTETQRGEVVIDNGRCEFTG